jgi:hypothetical protein
MLMSLREIESSIICLWRTHIIVAKEFSESIKIWLPHCVLKLHFTGIADYISLRDLLENCTYVFFFQRIFVETD